MLLKRAIRRFGLPVGLLLAVAGCASIGTLQGGPYDEDPPVFLGAVPAMGELNNTRTKLTIEFDEYIVLSNASEKLVFSPPQQQQPEVKASNKKVIIKLADSLKANTTYTIDFGDAIQDNNENNPLEGFVYTFSTGDKLDTMSVSGLLLNAADLEPVKGMMVGLQSNLNDTAFTSLPFERVGTTDSRGRFSIKGIAPGEYRMYALKDMDQNFYFSQPGEAIAFLDSLVVPSMERRTRQDTSWIDSLTIDTIIPREYTHFLPDDILLRCFTELNFNQRLARSERLTPKKFSLYFTAPADSLPSLQGLNFDATDAFVVEQTTGRNDTLHYWIRDSLIYQLDTLKMSISYLYTDSTNQLVPRTDTLRLVSKERPKTEKQLEEERKAKEKDLERKRKEGNPDTLDIKYLSMSIYAPSSMDVYDYISLTFEEPVQQLPASAIHLQHKVDSLYEDVAFDLEADTLDRKVYNVIPRDDWEFGGSYTVEVDSGMVVGLYGLSNKKASSNFTVKKPEDYGAIFFDVTGLPNTAVPAFVQLLSEKDVPLRTVDVVKGKADFYFLPPAKYCARLIVDENGNRQWDTGLYAEKRQPEQVYYYWQILDLKANFELNQTWDVTARALDKQKPDDMKKQKPDETKKKNRNSN